MLYKKLRVKMLEEETSISKLSRDINISRQWLSRVFNGKKDFSESLKSKIAECLGIAEEDIPIFFEK